MVLYVDVLVIPNLNNESRIFFGIKYLEIIDNYKALL